MADVEKAFSDLDTAGQLDNTDIFALSKVSGNSWISAKASLTALATKIATAFNFTGALQTTDKTLTGAINEVAQGSVSADVIADEFSTESTYVVDDYVMHEGSLYKCTTAVTTAGAWDSTKWTETLVMDEVAQGGGGGASSLDDLSDVSIDSLTLADGQVLAYDALAQEFKNVTGGGGTNVVANPQVISAESLDRIQIGNTVYSIASNVELDLVPRLTANDSAAYIGTSSDNAPVSSSFQPWHAFATESQFDAAQNGGYWATNSIDGYLQFSFTSAVSITRVIYAVYDASTFLIQYSEDGTNWTDGPSISRTRKSAGSYICVAEETKLITPLYGRYFRFKATANSAHNIGAVHLMGYEGRNGIKEPYVDLTGTLTAGQTSITLSNASLTTSSTIEVFNDLDVPYNSKTLSTGSITLTFDAQASNMSVKVRVS